MTKPSNTIEKTLILYAGVPMFLLLVAVVGLLISIKGTEFIDARGKLIIQVNQMVSQMDEFPGDRMDEIEAIRREHLADINHDFLQFISVALAFLLIGIAVPVVAFKHVSVLLARI